MKLQEIFNKVDQDILLSKAEVVFLLGLQGAELERLYNKADQIRKQIFGDDVYLRGIIEFSNYCRKDCNYCGIRKSNKELHYYRMSADEILDTCKKIEKAGQTTVVLQSGEDLSYSAEILGDIIEKIKNETSLAVTLSVGERDEKTYKLWKEKSMDRYLLRFETSNRELFKLCHPDDDLDERIECIKILKKLRVQTGSGFLIGLPDETIRDLASDILFCTELDLDMIGVGPFIPHGNTPFGKTKNPFEKEIYFKTMAILRLLNKKANIPSTTAFDAIDKKGRDLLLMRGANIFMPNSTPKKYRKYYLLYPGKPCVDESAEDCSSCVIKRISALGRKIGKGPGHSIKTEPAPTCRGGSN